MYKQKSNCIVCGKEFEHYKSQKRKYCGQDCYAKPGRKNRTEDQKTKISKITKQYYSTASEEDKRKRWDNISKAKTKTLTKEEQDRVLDVLSWGYVHDLSAVIRHAKIKEKGVKPIISFLKSINTYKVNDVKYLPLSFQMWDKKKFTTFKSDSEILDHRRMEQKYKIGKKSFKSICDKLNIRWGKIETPNCKETWPERKMELILQEFDIPYVKQKYFLESKYRADFMIQGLKILEVHGDYWHANPEVYDYNQLSPTQMRNIIRDIKRREDCKNNNIPILEIWERDLRINIEKVKQQIQEYANK